MGPSSILGHKVNVLGLAVVACRAAVVSAAVVAVFLFPNDLWKISSANIILSAAVAQFASRRIFIDAASAVANRFQSSFLLFL